MKKLILPVLAISFILAITSCSEDPQGKTREEVKKEIHKVYNKAVSEWNNKNMRGYMQMFWKSDSLRVASGAQAVYGWQRALDTSIEQDPQGEYMGQAYSDEFRIFPINPSNAWSYTRFRIEAQGDVMRGSSTDIWEKKDGNWRIVHSHISYGQ
ncbi:Cif family virulence factor [Halocola ammonii]